MEGAFTLVYVEDDEFMRESLADFLGVYFRNINVVVVDNLRDAQDAIKNTVGRGEQLVVLTDLNYTMGRDQAGFELIKHVHAEYPSIPCILYTGELTSAVRDHCMKIGVSAFEKAGDVKALAETVKQAYASGPGSGNAAPAAAKKGPEAKLD